MIEDYTLLVKAIQHIIRKGKSSNLCVLKDSGLFVDIKNNDFNGRDFILRLDNRGKFIYSGDMKNLIKNTSNIVNMYLEGRRNIGEEISQQLRTLLSELENKIMQLEDFSINSWSLEITRNFIRLYNEDTTVSKTQNNAEYTEICKNEAESWISQIKNLLFISRNNNRNNFEDDKLFWNTYLSNLSGLETFFNSKVVLYLESQLRNINELILLSSLQVLKKLEKHYQICNAFIDFYFGINMENIYAFKDIKEFSDSCINLIKYILKEISKYPRIVKSHISRLMNNYYKYILNVLRSNSLLENKRVIKNILVFVIENYDEMQCLINDNIGLDNGNEIVLKDNKCQFLYCVKILEELECVVDAKIILKNFRKYCDDESLINEIDKNVLIVEKHIMNRWESFEEKDDQIFENMCLENITNLFKYLSSCRNKLNVKELYENLKDKIKQKIIDNDIGTCTERIDDIIEINEVLIEKENSCIELSLIVQYFFVFQRFKTFNEKTILIRLKILQNIDIYLFKVNEILEKNNFNLYKDFLQIINLLKYIEVTKHHFFHGNYENVVMLEKVNLKIQDIYTDLENRFNFELEKNYNFIKKMDIFEKKILFVLDNSMKVYDLTKVYEICECFNTVELFLKSNNVDLMEMIRIIYHKYSGIITSEMNKSNRILDSTNSFMQKLTNSYFYKILKGEVKTILESKIKYNVFKNQLEIFNNIINELNEDVDIFCKFIDGVFETYKKVFNLKFKYLMINNYEIDLEERMTEFQKAYFDFVLLTCKIKQNDQINFFKDSGSINFSFDSSSYVKKIKNVEFTFVSRAIDRSFKYILKQYLQNIISLLKKGDKDFFTVKCTIKTNNPPELAGIFKIFEKIFPSKNSKFFFENVIGKIQIDDEIASLITCIIEKVVSIHKNCTNELEVLYSPVCNDNLIKLYEHTMKKIEVIRKIKFNEFLFFDFAYDECKNMVDLQPILQNIKREVCLRLRKVNKKIRLECGDLNLFDNFSSLLEYLKDKDVVEKVKVQGKILKIYKYLLIKFNQIKRLKEILEENNIYTDDKNYIILDKYYKKMPFLFKSTREQLKCKDKLSDKNEYKKLKDEILNELTVIENCLVEIKDIEDEQDLVKRLDEIERKIFDIIEISKYLNYILQVIREDVIEVKIMSLFVNIKKRVDEHKRIRNNWVRFIDTPLNSLDINQVRIFLESLERFTPVLPLEKLLIKKINSSKELCLSLHTIYHPYVTEEFLDRNMKLGDCISNFTVDSLRKIVFLSENDFKIKLGLESIMNALSMLFYIYNDFIINFDEIENRLYDILADANILQSFNKNEKYIDKLSNISCNIYELINLNREIKDIQDGLNDFNNIFIGEVFEKEKVLYDRIRKEYVDFVCKNLIVNEGLKEDLISIEIQFRDKKISLANIYKNKDVIRHLKENIVSMNGIIKKTINHYRESIVRLFFVSDSDIINLLSGRAQYNDILKQVYNIDDVIIEEESIIGIRSCEEKLYFEVPISLKLSIIDFFVYFDRSLRDELIKYAYAKLKKKYKDILEQNKDVKLDILSGIDSASFSSNSKNTMCSVIDEILNELYYFNDLPYDRSIKIEFIKEYRKQNGDDFLVFYPKPTLNDNKILVNDISNKVYDFEYYPPTDIIFTRLTSIIFSSIALGLNKSSGIILFGNSGTGKTETVKYYCKSVGKQVIVFCCSDDCDLKSLENIIIGCKRLGAYLCLDEFNRLNEGTMSSITEVIYKNKESVKFFLTMNLGYTGRNQLPKTLSSIFSEVRVDTPDLKDILQIYFKNYSSKLMLLLNRLSENCESHRHYNFGLRAIKTILRNIKIYKEGDNPNLEEDITLNSIYNFYYSSLSNCDKEKLNLIFSEIFKVSINLNLSYEDMLQFGLQNSRGVLLYGYSQSGKSYLLKNCLTSEYSNIFYFNPYNVEYFFGTYDPISGDWIDSEFTEALRINKNEKVVFVFDTIMDSKWIENLNSVLDDTSSLCLKSGEVIKLSNSVKFIFEADNIDKLTPATLTRLTTIFIERNNVSCKKLDIFYQDEPVEALGIIQTKQRSFYTGKIKEILGTHRILFIKGECGKKSLVKNSIVETKIIFLNAYEMKNRFLRNFLDEKEIIMVKNVKVCISNVIFYIDQFEFADDNLVESVREFIEYGKIGDVIIKQMKIICAYDLNIEHKRLESKGYVIMIDQDKEIDVYMRHELKQGGVFDSDISKIVGILCMLNEKSIIRYKDIKKITNLHQGL